MRGALARTVLRRQRQRSFFEFFYLSFEYSVLPVVKKRGGIRRHKRSAVTVDRTNISNQRDNREDYAYYTQHSGYAHKDKPQYV